VDQKELALLYTCLFEEINSCIKDDCLEHLKHLIDFLTFALENSKQNDALGRCFSHQYVFFTVLRSIVSSDYNILPVIHYFSR
jgi:hypothetical protein